MWLLVQGVYFLCVCAFVYLSRLCFGISQGVYLGYFPTGCICYVLSGVYLFCYIGNEFMCFVGCVFCVFVPGVNIHVCLRGIVRCVFQGVYLLFVSRGEYIFVQGIDFYVFFYAKSKSLRIATTLPNTDV